MLLLALRPLTLSLASSAYAPRWEDFSNHTQKVQKCQFRPHLANGRPRPKHGVAETPPKPCTRSSLLEPQERTPSLIKFNLRVWLKPCS